MLKGSLLWKVNLPYEELYLFSDETGDRSGSRSATCQQWVFRDEVPAEEKKRLNIKRRGCGICPCTHYSVEI